MNWDAFCRVMLWTWAVMLAAFLALFAWAAHAQHHAGHHAPNVPQNVQDWFRAQHSPQGLWCCDISDGHICNGVDMDGSPSPCLSWDQDGKAEINKVHKVRIQVVGLNGKAEWHDVPDERVIDVPGNPTGDAVAWFKLYDPASFGAPIWIYCFAIGGGS